jgi:hypothetical protein
MLTELFMFHDSRRKMMKNNWIAGVLIFCISIFLINGCKDKNSTEPIVTDQDAMKEIVSNDAFFSADNTALNDGDISESQTTSLGKVTADIIPSFWGRKIESATRSIVFTEIANDSASAVVTNSWTGIVWIKGKYSVNDTSLSLITKNVTESTTRNVKFVRISRDKDVRKNWRISEISAMQGGTVNGSITFTKVTFYIGGDTLVITHPLDYYFKVEKRNGSDGLHSVSQTAVPSFKIRVEITSSDPVGNYVIAYRPIWDQLNRVYRRGLMTLVDSSQNGNIYTRVYENTWRGAWSGRHHVFVGAIPHQSLFDDTVPFASQIWGIPYLVEP